MRHPDHLQSIYQSIALLPEQIAGVRAAASDLHLPARHFRQAVLAGMGGSALGGDIVQALYAQRLTGPLLISRDYRLPFVVGRDTLVIASSYSGSTEETLADAREAMWHGATVVGLTSGGALAKLLRQHGQPVVEFSTLANPSGQPRLGFGYLTFGLVAILQRAGLLRLPINELRQVEQEAAAAVRWASQRRQVALARAAVKRIIGRQLLIVAAEHLAGNAHLLANQCHENAKHLTAYHLLPELSHHFLEGLSVPRAAVRGISLLSWRSAHYRPRLQLRLRLTERITAKRGIRVIPWATSASSARQEVLQGMVLGSVMSAQLAEANGVDPLAIPWVDYLKEQLRRSTTTH